MPPKRNQQNEDQMEEIRKSLSSMPEEISKVIMTINIFRTEQTRYKLISTPDPTEK